MVEDSAGAVGPAVVAADSASRSVPRIELLGIAIDTMRRSDIERRIVEHLADCDAGMLHVATVNPEYVVGALRDRAFHQALASADLTVPDGVGIVAAARLLCSQEIRRVTGVELVEFLLSVAGETAPRIFLLGNAASVAELQGRHPTRVVGRWGDGSAAPCDDVESIERIRDRAADVVLVGYGAPGQVLWIERNRRALADAGVRLAIGVGGALDFAAGTVDRAPAAVQRLGLEWSYRLLREPWRWRRQLALPVFSGMVLRGWLRRFLGRQESACRILAYDDEPNQHANP